MESSFLSESAPAPGPQPYGVSARWAEFLVAEWVAHLGQKNVHVTKQSGDGGYDVGSDEWIVQVKNYQGSVGVSELRELVGVASVETRSPVLFTSGSVTREALQYAERADLAIFRYSAEEGKLEPVGATAENLVEDARRHEDSAAWSQSSESLPDTQQRLDFWDEVFRWGWTDPGHRIRRGASMDSMLESGIDVPSGLEPEAKQRASWNELLFKVAEFAREDGIDLPEPSNGGWKEWPALLFSAAGDHSRTAPGPETNESNAEKWTRQHRCLQYDFNILQVSVVAQEVLSNERAFDLADQLSAEIEHDEVTSNFRFAASQGLATVAEAERTLTHALSLARDFLRTHGADLGEFESEYRGNSIQLSLP